MGMQETNLEFRQIHSFFSKYVILRFGGTVKLRHCLPTCFQRPWVGPDAESLDASIWAPSVTIILFSGQFEHGQVLFMTMGRV